MRRVRDKVFKAVVLLLAFLVLVPLLLIFFQIVKNGISVINWRFFVETSPAPGESGGILNSLVGSLLLMVISFLVAVPLGLGTGLFLVEFEGSRFARYLEILVNTLHSVPSIVVGIVAYLWVVKPLGGFSALSGGVALAMIMYPLIVRSTHESLKLVPVELKEASFALGAGYFKTVVKVVLPSGFGGIASGILISVSRAVGETAPLLFTAFGNPYVNLNPLKPVDALPLLIYNYAMSPYEQWHRVAWGASLVLILMVFVLNLTVRMLRVRWRVKF